MINLDVMNNVEVAALLFAIEREFDWARRGEDYDITDEYLDTCSNLLEALNEEYVKREITLDILGPERE